MTCCLFETYCFSWSCPLVELGRTIERWWNDGRNGPNFKPSDDRWVLSSKGRRSIANDLRPKRPPFRRRSKCLAGYSLVVQPGVENWFDQRWCPIVSACMRMLVQLKLVSNSNFTLGFMVDNPFSYHCYHGSNPINITGVHHLVESSFGAQIPIVPGANV